MILLPMLWDWNSITRLLLSLGSTKASKRERYLAKKNIFHEVIHLDEDPISKDYNNTFNLKHCLSVANFSGNPGDISVLKKEKDMYELRVAASNIRLYVSKTFWEWEGGQNRGDRSKGTSITGLAKIIMTFQKRIKNAQRLP